MSTKFKLEISWRLLKVAFQTGNFALLKLIFLILIHQSRTTMGNLSAAIAAAAVTAVDFKTEALETSAENLLLTYGKVYEAALALDATPEETQAVAAGVLSLASQFGQVFNQLTQEQGDQIKATVAAIVTGPDEVAVETLFNNAVDFIAAAQSNNAAIDAATEVAE